MMDYGVHGVFQQRFVSDIAGGGDMLRFRDQIVKNMIAAAPSTGRAWCIEYDTTGSKDATVLSVLTKDWCVRAATWYRLTASTCARVDLYSGRILYLL